MLAAFDPELYFVVAGYDVQKKLSIIWHIRSEMKASCVWQSICMAVFPETLRTEYDFKHRDNISENTPLESTHAFAR